jgi:hypothetical protein
MELATWSAGNPNKKPAAIAEIKKERKGFSLAQTISKTNKAMERNTKSKVMGLNGLVVLES